MQGWIVAIGTAILVIVTAAYALFTWGMLKELRQQRRQMVQERENSAWPILGLEYRYREPSGTGRSSFWDIAVRNDGPGFAFGIDVSISGTVKGQLWVAALGPNQSVTTGEHSRPPNTGGRPRPEGLTLEATYKDALGRDVWCRMVYKDGGKSEAHLTLNGDTVLYRTSRVPGGKDVTA